jgi:hypothetical protein
MKRRVNIISENMIFNLNKVLTRYGNYPIPCLALNNRSINLLFSWLNNNRKVVRHGF